MNEQVMPQDVIIRLDRIVKDLKDADKLSKPSTISVIQGILDPMNAALRDTSDKQLSEWVLNRVLPGLETIYNAYPIQTRKRLEVDGLMHFLDRLSTRCSQCGSDIPKVGHCPYCNDQAKPAKKTMTEDPMAILKLRLAKGEVTREEYEELKRRIEA